MKTISRLSPLMIGLITASVLSAQGILERDQVPLTNWDAPMYWQLSAVESKDAAAKQLLAGTAGGDRSSSITAQAQNPANSLVFVGMTPCRVVDTRGGVGSFGGPALISGTSRTFPIPSSANCSIPSIAQAYSFNVTVVPNGFLDYITVWPTGQIQPLASTLNGYVNTVIANAAIVPAGTNGSVDVYASQNTHLIIDINGYYAQPTGITLASGTESSPPLSFWGDSLTGLYSPGPGALSVTTGGTSRVSVTANGSVGIGTTNPDGLQIGVPVSENARAVDNVRFGVNAGTPRAIFEDAASSTQWEIDNSDGRFRIFNPGAERFTIDSFGRVGIGITEPFAQLHVFNQGTDTAVRGTSINGYGAFFRSTSSVGVYGLTTSGDGVIGSSNSGYGVSGSSTSSVGVYGHSSSSTSYAGYFEGNVHYTGTLTQGSDVRLKKEVASLGYGLREVLQLRPVTWTWKAKPDGGRQLGLIAQEVETVLPELVSTDRDADQTKGLNYIGLVPVTIKAIQEQQEQIEQQHAQIEDQQKRITEQQQQLEQQQHQIDGLKQLICLDRPQAAVCK